METLIIVLVVAAATGALGLALGRYIWPAPRSADQIALTMAQNDASRLDLENSALNVRVDELSAELRRKSDALQEEEKKSTRLDERVNSLTKQAEEQVDAIGAATGAQARAEGLANVASENSARLAEREIGLAKEIAALTEQVRELVLARDTALRDAKTSGEEAARLTEREQSLAKQVVALEAQQTGLQETLKVEFENIATKVLKANASELTDTSQKQIAAILDPLRQRIQEFQGKVETTYDAEKREILALKEQIRLIVETSQTLGSQADGLAKALKGDVQMLGRWGELVLERILQAAGLVEGREFVSQGRGLGLKNDTGGTQKPDIVVMLPEKRTMIIDSKVSLASYDRLIAAKEEIERAEHTGQFVRDVKNHIDGLSGKRYQDNEQLTAHDCVLMFMPIEGALAAALTAEPELFTYAWDKRVVLVGPPTLLMTLRTVASIWRYELQAQNAQEIAKLAGALCDKVSDSLTDLNTVGERMNQAISAHNDAVKRLSSGKGNALSIGERIRNLGVKTKKIMPAMLVGGEPISAEVGDEDRSQEEPSGSEPLE